MSSQAGRSRPHITALKVAFAGIALFALLAFAYVHRLPRLAVTPEPGQAAP